MVLKFGESPPLHENREPTHVKSQRERNKKGTVNILNKA